MYTFKVGLPDNNYREVQDVPAVAEVSSLMANEAISYNLHHAFHRKNHKKDVFYLLLQEKKAVNNKKKRIDADLLSLKEYLRVNGY